MEGEHRLSLPSRLIVLGTVIGYVMVSIGLVAYGVANAPLPPGARHDSSRDYQKAVDSDHAAVVAGLGTFLIVFLMFILGVTADELDPRMRTALVITSGVIPLAFALLFVSIASLIMYR